MTAILIIAKGNHICTRCHKNIKPGDKIVKASYRVSSYSNSWQAVGYSHEGCYRNARKGEKS